MPFLRRGGALGIAAAQGNAATLRARGITPSITLRFRAGELTHQQMLQAAVASPGFASTSRAGRRVVAELRPPPRPRVSSSARSMALDQDTFSVDVPLPPDLSHVKAVLQVTRRSR